MGEIERTAFTAVVVLLHMILRSVSVFRRGAVTHTQMRSLVPAGHWSYDAFCHLISPSLRLKRLSQAEISLSSSATQDIK